MARGKQACHRAAGQSQHRESHLSPEPLALGAGTAGGGTGLETGFPGKVTQCALRPGDDTPFL